MAAFVVPKVLGGSDSSRHKAVLKSTILAIDSIVEQAMLEGALPTDSGSVSVMQQLFRNKLNAVKVCIWAAGTNGCWDATNQGATNGAGGFVLANGVNASRIMRYSFSGNVYSEILIDSNGATGPNQEGIDQIFGYICYTPSGCPGIQSDAGKFTARYAPNEAYYEALFSN